MDRISRDEIIPAGMVSSQCRDDCIPVCLETMHGYAGKSVSVQPLLTRRRGFADYGRNGGGGGERPVRVGGFIAPNLLHGEGRCRDAICLVMMMPLLLLLRIIRGRRTHIIFAKHVVLWQARSDIKWCIRRKQERPKQVPLPT